MENETQAISVSSSKDDACPRSNIPTPDISGWDTEPPLPSGHIFYPLTNDFMFKYSFQENLYALKGLLSALLFIDVDMIHSIVILNPIQPGDTPNDKTCILDIKLLLNVSAT